MYTSIEGDHGVLPAQGGWGGGGGDFLRSQRLISASRPGGEVSAGEGGGGVWRGDRSGSRNNRDPNGLGAK